MYDQKIISQIAYMLVIIGAINWGIIGAFGPEYDLVALLFQGSTSIAARVVYILVGLSGLVLGWCRCSCYLK